MSAKLPEKNRCSDNKKLTEVIRPSGKDCKTWDSWFDGSGVSDDFMEERTTDVKQPERESF